MHARRRRRVGAAALALLALSACGERARHTVEQTSGPTPQLVEPVRTLMPTVRIAKASGWRAGERPSAATGLRVNAFASGLAHPRWLLALANGDVLVAESDTPPAPPQPLGLRSVKSAIQGLLMKRAGSNRPSADRIRLLRDGDGDGIAEQRSVLIDGLRSPFGMALVGSRLFIANTDALVAVPFAPGEARITARPVLVTRLPGARNHHWTKSLAASPDGRRLYVGVGSNSNVGENGLDEEAGRAAVWEVDPASGAHRILASGLRNPVGLAFHPTSGELWTVVNERDELGSDLVPDYLTAVKPGGFYGWPWSYFGGHVDQRVKPQRPDMVARAIVPDYALGAHVAPLGLAFSAGARLGPRFAEGAFVGQHGSWNRNPPSGYRVVFVPFAGGRPSGLPVELLGGFLKDGKARGRPAGVAVAADGALLVADDVGGAVWRVSAADPVAAR